MRWLYVASLLAVTTAQAAPKPKAQRHARKKFSNRVVAPADAKDSPAYRYGNLSQDDCEAELKNRSIDFERVEARGVGAPVRIKQALHGVTFRTDGKDHEDSAYEITDCRLALALDDFAAELAQHDIVEVRHYSIYRPPPKSWPEGKVAQQHIGAVAIDAGRFIKSDGSVLDVVKHFHGAIGAKTCGDGAGPHPVTPEATELRTILCDAVEHRLFNIYLTPNFNRPHHNHFHLEVTGANWFLVH